MCHKPSVLDRDDHVATFHGFDLERQSLREDVLRGKPLENGYLEGQG
jgi:hypothetical protein